MNTLISVVIPVFGCKTTLTELYLRLTKTLEHLATNHEIILVNDGCLSGSWEVIRDLAKRDHRVRGFNFSRNFGQHYAITAGLEKSQGDWVVIMDCDLQDQPEELPKLFEKALEGFEVVLALRKERQDSYLKKLSSYLYYTLLSKLTESHFDPRVGSFRILSRSVVKEFNNMKEYYRFFGAMIQWLGFSVAYVEVTHQPRIFGKSSYSFRKSLSLAINGVLSFSEKPLKLTIAFGVFIVLASSIFILIKVIGALFYGTTATGWTSLIASVFFSTGIIVSILGVIGLYIGRIFGQVKQRPLFVIKESTETPSND